MQAPRNFPFKTAGVFALGMVVAAGLTFAAMRSASAGASQPAAATTLSQAAALWQQAAEQRSGDQMAAFFAPDIWAMYPQPLPTLGRDANRESWVGSFLEPDFVHPLSIDTVIESEQGDLGFTFGRWWAIQPSVGLHLGGRFVAIWRPIDGHWQITHLSANLHDDITAEQPPSQ